MLIFNIKKKRYWTLEGWYGNQELVSEQKDKVFETDERKVLDGKRDGSLER